MRLRKDISQAEKPLLVCYGVGGSMLGYTCPTVNWNVRSVIRIGLSNATHVPAGALVMLCWSAQEEVAILKIV